MVPTTVCCEIETDETTNTENTEAEVSNSKTGEEVAKAKSYLSSSKRSSLTSSRGKERSSHSSRKSRYVSTNSLEEIPEGSGRNRRHLRKSNSLRELLDDEKDIDKVVLKRAISHKRFFKRSESARDVADEVNDTSRDSAERTIGRGISSPDDGDKPIKDAGSGDPLSSHPRRKPPKSLSGRIDDDPLNVSSHRRREIRKTNSSRMLDSQESECEGQRKMRSNSSCALESRSRSRSKHGKLIDYSKIDGSEGKPLSVYDLFATEKAENLDLLEYDESEVKNHRPSTGWPGGLDLSVHSEKRPVSRSSSFGSLLDVSAHGSSGSSGSSVERNSRRQRLLEEEMAAGGGASTIKIDIRPFTRSGSASSLKSMEGSVGSAKENTMDMGRIERLKAQRNLYREHFKVIMKEKKELIGVYNAKIEAKRALMKHLEEEIAAIKLENGKLKASLAKSGTGSNGSARKKPESSANCHLSPDTNVLITSHPRPRPSLFFLPGLRSMPFWSQFNSELFRTEVAYQDASLAWAVGYFEQYWGDIADEYQSVAPFLPSDKDAETSNLAPQHEGNWSWYSHTTEGKANDNFFQHFPRTCDLLNEVREKGLLFEKLPFGHTFLCTLSKNSRLLNHTSPINLRIRLYLPLMVAGDHCDMSCLSGDSMSTIASTPVGIRVGPTTRGWQTGRAVLVDDSYDHELWNNESSAFVCLVADLWHPDVTIAERKELVELFQNTRVSDWMNPSSN